jgi:hypothetical protein
MTTKRSMRDFLWMATGAVTLLGVMLVVLHFYNGRNPAQQLARKADRLERVGRIRLAMATASEAEKSAVMAITDEDSQTFADQARAATAQAERERRELGERLASDGTANERKLLDQFSQAFADFQRIDADLLVLAVKNTNLKASSLAFGPAAAAIKEMDAALARLPTDDVNVLRLADNARIAVLRLQALLPPHIAEESDQKEDEMEAQMSKEDREVRRSLDALSALPGLAGNPDLKTAAANYAQFNETRAQIIKLSRENTNVRSLAISLTQKRKTTLLCQDALAALQQAIQAEPVAGVTYRLPINPR